ncbi:Kazal-type serine protease inhibitor domain-containing protein 1 [Fasciolopsis buskii]|uniref:Kazal-type serine protease inhibitor domain-containing protein 1 n=1 Tax=Fasciolopsis buskii TaxID=27845 RepID=A0A8E0RMA1_9TREM|nr:Kazal-type serine protease inhibitor domain-containing protein 1 [Fasciolopsis buski]
MLGKFALSAAVLLCLALGFAHGWYNSVFNVPKPYAARPHYQLQQPSPSRSRVHLSPTQQRSHFSSPKTYQQQQQQQKLLQQQPTVLEACGECDQTKCAKNLNCAVGLVRDRCGCCLVCGLEESHLCNLESEIPSYIKHHIGKPWYGRCGQNLECRVRNDVDPAFVGGSQSICYCLEPGLVCGSDGKTYSHCQLRAQIAATMGNVKKIGDGPCKQEPVAVLSAPNETVAMDEKVTLICEVRGYPRADVTWHMVKPGDAKSRRMPGKSADVTVSLRGGESETQVVSYLQITNFTLDHEGEYHCLAENELGMDDKAAHVVLKV